MDNTYYNGTKLLNTLDLDGEKPELFLCVGNRSAGKTTFFNRWCINRFLKHGEKFALLYRYNYELDNCADKFFKDINGLFFPDYHMESERRAAGTYHELYLNDKSCGYAISINSADQLKKNSHFFSDVERIIFDEFQTESGKYCPNEITKFQSIHTTIARGQGKQYRYTPVILISNAITLLNPYFVELGISGRVQRDTKFLKGNGYVLEVNINESAAKKLTESRFNIAFNKNKYLESAAQNIYLYDNVTFIEKPQGTSRYIATLTYKGVDYSIKEYAEAGIIYCDDKADKTNKFKIAVTTDDHNINYVMLKKNDIMITTLRYYFEKGCFRFKNLSCKNAILSALAYY